MTCVTSKAGNRHTTRHHQRESPALGSARQNRYTDPLHTASADRRHALATQAKGRGVASDATFRHRHKDDGAGDPAGALSPPLTASMREPQVRVGLQGSGCIRCHDVASSSVAFDASMLHPAQRQSSSDEGRCAISPSGTLRYSAWLVIRSLPVSAASATRSPRPTRATPTAEATPELPPPMSAPASTRWPQPWPR